MMVVGVKLLRLRLAHVNLFASEESRGANNSGLSEISNAF